MRVARRAGALMAMIRGCLILSIAAENAASIGSPPSLAEALRGVQASHLFVSQKF
jgi:hypothetical protein